MMTQYLRTLGGRVLMPALALVALSSPVSAQLANTPWPMFQHDAAHTGRSPLSRGPVYPLGRPDPAASDGAGGKQVTFVKLGVKIKAQPSVGTDGAIYLGVGWKFCRVPASMVANDVRCTDLPSDISASTVAVDLNGVAYLGDRNNSVSAFQPSGIGNGSDGGLLCRYNFGHEGDVNTHIAIGGNGTVYFAQGQSEHGLGPVVAIEPAPDCGQRPAPGQLAVDVKGDASGELWFIKADTTIGSSSPAIAKVGADTFLYIGDNSGFVHKYQDCLAGFSDTSPCAGAGGAPVVEVWTKRHGAKVRASPVIGADGTVFIGTTTGFHALDPATGVALATFPVLGGFPTSTAALAEDGTIYVGSQNPGKKKYLFALSWSGAPLNTLTESWRFGPVVSEGDMSPFPVVDGDGTIYATIGRGVYAIASNGQKRWSYTLDNLSLNHPSIGGTATARILYVGTASGRLYRFASAPTSSSEPPVANAGTGAGCSTGNPAVPTADICTSLGESVHFDGTASDDPVDGQDTCDSFNLTYSWDFGDGFTATVPCVDHTFWSPGLQTVTLTVSDGLLSDTATITVWADGSGPSFIDDDFNRSPGTALGNNWVEEQGDLVIASTPSGGVLQNTLTKANHIAIRPDLVGTNLSAHASFTSSNNSPGPRFGLILRHQAPGNYYVLYRQVGGTNALRIAKVVGGVETLLKSVPAPQGAAVQLNTPFVLSADATTIAGVTTLTLSQGGASVSVQDSTFSGGNVGIMLGTGSSGLNQYGADDFHAQRN